MAEMEYVEIPYVDKKVSRILFGTAMSSFIIGENTNELLDSIYETGVNAFDTARGYMLAERSLGKWIEEKNMREKIVILSKSGHPSKLGRKRVNEKEIREDFKKSTEHLRTDFIDIYLLHRDDEEVETGTIVEIFNGMYDEGKIGAFGGSNWTHKRIEAANEYAYKHSLIPFSVSSPNFGLANQLEDPWGGGCVTISGANNASARDWYRKTGMPVIAYSSLGRGLFSGKMKSTEIEKAGDFMDAFALKGYAYPENFERLKRCEEIATRKNVSVPQIAMAWIFKQDINTLAVVSTSKASRMQENIDALDIELSRDEILYLSFIM